MPWKSIPIEKRFWERVNKTETCWEWIGEINKETGYGRISFAGKGHGAHRVSWFLEHGEMPQNNICHKCDNRKCIRPDHLFDGTQRENIHDAMKKGRFVRGNRVANSKLTEEQVISIRREYISYPRGYMKGQPRNGIRTGSITDLAAKYGVKPITIHNIAKRKIWKHI